MTILVSACLLGLKCRYDGCSKENQEVLALVETHRLVPFCPEIYGGLATPRKPAELRDGRVVTEDGNDVTEAYQNGAKEALRLMRLLHCDCAVLQDRSPSCGCGVVHNGRFDGGLTEGDGITAALLKEHGCRVIRASEVTSLKGEQA